MKSVPEQLKLIKRGIVELIPEDEFIKKLEKGKPLRIKWGADPSAPDIHLGHTVVLNKLRQFQELGHEVIFIIGDFTARIGDPSGKSETRKTLAPETIIEYAKTYREQVFKILDKHKTRVVFNSQWLEKMNLMDIFKLSSHYTVARMLERKDFKERFEQEVDISVLEFMYPLLQGYDSVHLNSDVEIGGTDQKFNLLMGRTLQQRYGKEPQAIITLPLLEGTDGVQKMSKSLNNYIGITEPPSEIFGKTMSISDPLMLRYYELLTDENLDQIKSMHPKEAKKKLAHIFVSRFYSKLEADKAEAEFESVFKERNLPQNIPIKEIPKKLIDEIPWKEKHMIPLYKLLFELGMTESISKARHIKDGGGLKIDNKKIVQIKPEEVTIDGKIKKVSVELIDCSKEHIIQVGRRTIVKTKAIPV